MRVNHNTVVCLSLAVAALLAGIMLSGCAEEQIAPQAGPIFTSIDKADAVALAEAVLTDMHFGIDKADAEAGLVSTTPLRGGQFFEFWRHDNVGGRNAMEANLHSIRRTVELTIDPAEDRIRLQCKVLVQRLTIPEHRISSSTRAYRLFSRSSSSLQTLKFSEYQQQEMVWVDLGGDPELAAEVLRRIEQKIAMRRKEQTS